MRVLSRGRSAISRFVAPWATRPEIRVCCAVSSVPAGGAVGDKLSPAARSSAVARSAHGRASNCWKTATASRSSPRAALGLRARRSRRAKKNSVLAGSRAALSSRCSRRAPAAARPARPPRRRHAGRASARPAPGTPGLPAPARRRPALRPRAPPRPPGRARAGRHRARRRPGWPRSPTPGHGPPRRAGAPCAGPGSPPRAAPGRSPPCRRCGRSRAGPPTDRHRGASAGRAVRLRPQLDAVQQEQRGEPGRLRPAGARQDRRQAGRHRQPLDGRPGQRLVPGTRRATE